MTQREAAVARHPSESSAEDRRGVLLATATLSQFSASLAQQGTVVLGVFFASAYSLSLSQMGIVVSAATFGLVVSGLVVGSLVDRYGPRRVLFYGTLLMVAASAAIGAIHRLPLTVALLFALGLVLGTVPLAGTKAVLAAWPRERRGLPMGVRQMGVPVGALAAALLLPALASQFGLHALYFGFAVLLAVGGLAFCAALPPGVPLAAASADQPDRVRLRREVHQIVVPAISGFLLAWGQYALTAYTIPFLKGHAGVSIAVAGGLLALAQAGGAAARMLLGHLSDRLGSRRDLVLMATAACAALLACVVAVLPQQVWLVVLAPLWLLLGATMVGWNALMLTWSGERVSVRNAGAAMGLTTSAILLGAAISAPIFGFIVQASGTYRTAWFGLGALLAVAALLLWGNARWAAGRSRASRTPRTEPQAHAPTFTR